MESHTALRSVLLSFCFALLLLTTAAAQTPATFSTVVTPYGGNATRVPPADLNNDAREDLIAGQQVNSPLPGMSVILANGDGTFGPPHDYQFPNTSEISHSIITADVNQDGYLDIIVTAASAGFYEYLNNHDGTFHLQATFAPPSGKGFWVGGAGDFNHDGRVDLALDCYVLNTTTSSLCIYLGNPDGGFEVGPVIPVSGPIGTDILVGDFDGDGKADLALVGNTSSSSTAVDFWYGDGTGQFQEAGGTGTDSPQVAYQVGDADGDGKSDLIGAPSAVQPNFIVYYGNSARTQEHQIIPLSNCTAGFKPAVGDFNGDGIPDLAVVTMSDCTDQPSDWPHTVTVKYGQGNRSFGPESRLFSTSTGIYDLFAARTDQDSKPDIVTVHYTAMNPETDIMVFRNTTSGSNFPSCSAPVDSYFGINICSPGSSTTDTNVHFGIGAAAQTPLRKVEVWVDGTKANEQFAHAYSHYAFMDYDTTLSAGAHTIDVYAAGWDNELQHTSFTTNVASGTGGGGCGQPTVPGVNICSPANGSTVTSPFTISAAGRNSGPTAGMDVWLDGHKVGWYDSTTNVNVQATAGAGTHQLDVYAVGTNGELQQSTSVFTVSGSGGGGTCSAPSSPGVNICAPANGSTVSSPVTITAAGRNSGTTDGMDVWLDGHKLGWFPGTSVNTQATLSAGTHQLDIYAVGTNGELQQATSVFTVSGSGGGGGGGGGGGCPVPTSTGVNVCAPTEGSTVNTPVRIWASGNNGSNNGGLEVWIDGNKIGWYDAQTIDITVDLSLGAHRLTVLPTPYTGTGKAVVNFTVGGTGGGGGGPYTGPCDAPADANTLNMCSPVSGSTVPSPVRVAVHGGANVNTIEMWYDGVKTLVVSGAGGQNIDIPYGMPSGSHKIDFYGKSGATVLDHKFTQFTVTAGSSGDVQYAVPLHTLSSGPGRGQVSVTTGGDVTASVSGWSAGTYALKFCMYPASVYPDSSCINLGALTVDASGNGTTTVHFPQSGTWAGLFRLYDAGGNRVLETSGSLNSDGSAYGETYSAKVMTWVPSSTTNTAGAEVNGPQDPGSGLISVDYSTVSMNLTGAPANTTYSVVQCYMGGSSCYQIGTVTTDASGNASVGPNTVPLTPGPVGVFRLSRVGASGFISGFRVP